MAIIQALLLNYLTHNIAGCFGTMVCKSGSERTRCGIMQPGDLIRVRDQYTGEYITGIILQVRNRQVLCLWHGGEISWCGTWQVEVVNDNR